MTRLEPLTVADLQSMARKLDYNGEEYKLSGKDSLRKRDDVCAQLICLCFFRIYNYIYQSG